MKRAILVLALLTTNVAMAETFDFELRGAYERSDSAITSFVTTSVIDPNLPPGTVLSATETQADQFAAGFTWFWDSLSDSRGPRSEAIFTDRASFLSVSGVTGEAEIDATAPTIQLVESFESDVDGIGFSGRYVLKDSGWVFAGNASFVETSAFGASIDVDQLTVTVGKYLGEMTSLELALGRTEAENNLGDSDTDSGARLSFKHIGNAFSGWLFGVDVGVSNQSLQGSTGAYDAAFSLYPSRDWTLSLTVAGQLGAEDIDTTRYTLEAGWFVNPQLELRLGLTETAFDEPQGLDLDEDGFFVSARYRF